MLDIKKINNSVVVVSDDNIFYPNDNTNSYPLNSLMVVVDESDMAIFKSAANGDVLFSALIDDLTINGSKTSKDTIFNDLDGVISAPQGGGGGGTVDAYTKAESDAKYGTKAEQESLRGDVENALGEIAALGYDKADKKDTYTKAEVDEKLSDVKGGDEHYKSVVTDGMGDAPVITVINGEIVTPDPTPNSDGITIIMQQGTWKFKRTNTSVPIFKLSTWEQGEAELGYWNNSKSCFVFRDDVISFENGFLSSEWLVNGKTIKKSFNVNFETGAELHFGTEWSESDSLEIRKIDEFNGQFYLENFGYADADDLTPRRNYKTIDNAIEVDYRGDKYHLLPKERLKTINGQSIVGTGNLTVTDSSIQSYSSGSATSGTYYKINGSAINKWNDKQDKLTAGDGITIEGNVISAVGGGGDVDLSNYPTKQEVNQTYLQKEGEYVKAVTTNGGAINFEKGNGTPDVVNFKTINNQSIFGMDNIKVPTDRDIESKVNEVISETVFGDTALAVTQIGFWEEDSRMNWVKSTLSGTHTQDDFQYFKTINGQSILGQGDIVVSGGGSIDMSNYYTKNEVDNLIPKIYTVTQSEYDRIVKDENAIYLIKEDDNTSGGGDAGGYL